MSGKHSRSTAVSPAKKAVVSAALLGVGIAGPSLALAPTAMAESHTTISMPMLTKAQIAVAYAKSKINGLPYLWGGNGPDRFDCSGLTSQAWKAAGVDFTGYARTSQDQLAKLPRVSMSNIKPGDLIIYTFNDTPYAGHVAMYVGPIGPNGEDMIDTASRHPGGGVGWSSRATRGGHVEGVVRPAPYVSPPVAKPTTKPEPKPSTEPHRGLTYTVREGDCLSKIAARYGTTWPKLYEKNRDKIDDPDLIFPGQVLKI